MATISIPFQIKAKDGVIYSDAIVLDEDHTLTDQEIEAIKQDRYNNWLIARNFTD